MSPNDPRSWLNFKPISTESRSHMGANSRPTDMDDTEYRGVPITKNVPILGDGQAFTGSGHTGTFILFTL